MCEIKKHEIVRSQVGFEGVRALFIYYSVNFTGVVDSANIGTRQRSRQWFLIFHIVNAAIEIS